VLKVTLQVAALGAESAVYDCLVYHRGRQAPSAARCRRTGPLATADTYHVSCHVTISRGLVCLYELFFIDNVVRLLSCKVKYTDIAVCSLTCHTATGTHMPYSITQCYLPSDRCDIPAFIAAPSQSWCSI